MKKYFIVIFLTLYLGASILVPAGLKAQVPAANKLLISEVFPGNTTSASQEFIELYNPSEDEIDLTGWNIQYASSTGLSWRVLPKLTFNELSVAPKAFYLLTTDTFTATLTDGTFSTSMGQNGGQLRVVDNQGVVQDSLSWGPDSTMVLGSPAPAPLAGQSLSRKFSSGSPSLLADNSQDFGISNTLSPRQINTQTGSINTDQAGSVVPNTIDPSLSSSQGNITSNTESLIKPLQISEILPNPASPQSDASDEFVEIYNPNDNALNLTGYQLVAGSNDSYKWTIKTGSIGPGSYAVFYSRDTTLSLSNSGGRVKLIAPTGTQIDQTDSYSAAPDGQAWIKADSGWVWTTTPTPGSPNIITLPTDNEPAVLASSTTDSSYADLEISELLPNPKSPQTDASDEFVELYNSTNQTVNLNGYKLVAGLNGTYKFTFKDQTIGPMSYEAFYSRATKLTLSNTGGKVALFAPDGIQIDQTEAYGKAEDGQAWIFASGKWQWSTTPTPGKANIFTAAVATTKTTKAAAKKVKKSRASAVKNISKDASNVAADNPQHQSSLNPLLLAGIGAAALIYAGYEYRHDLANQFYKLRRYREARRDSRQAS